MIKIMDDIINDDYFHLIGNKKSKIYHIDNCYCLKLIKQSNRVDVDDDHLDDDGNHYRACGKCLH